MLKAKDIMTKDVITIRDEATVEELARLLMEHRISGVPVVNDENKIEGIVTENDLIRKNKRLHIPTVIRLFDAYLMVGSKSMEKEIKNMAATTVDEICTRKVVSITEETSLDEIATIMAEQHVHLLPVLSDGAVVGIVGKADVVRSMTNEASK
ncbi:MAG: CBS domain-containing protein [Thermodesulfovibrionia bacterium]|nr:CBS domain-containing protein [Thermodesulfovibrionia bacterium]